MDLISRMSVIVAVALLGAAPAAAQQLGAQNGLWRDVDPAMLAANASAGARKITPARFRSLELDLQGLRALLARTPLESPTAGRSSAAVLSLPWPDGGMRAFRIEESPMMEPGLAAIYPEIKTYRGQGIDDPTASMRFDVTPAGFHAMVLSDGGNVYIDPYATGDTRHYMSYYRRDYARAAGNQFNCGVNEAEVARASERQRGAYLPNQVPNGTQRRNYRLALAATAEYTAVFGNATNAAAAMVTTMNRVNGIYERDFAVFMTLVAGNSALIYTNASTDPYSNDDGFTMLCQNAKNIDLVIGQANYDIGHVFSTGGGGVAGLGVVCSNSVAICVTTGSNKGRGVTGSSAPFGDGYDVDYVAHEMGHQFGGNHTFNSITSNCGGGNRVAGKAYEPGSGSTIMAYAGICGNDNLQPNSDAYFHAANQTEIVSFIQSGGGSTCGTVTATGNTPPTINAGSDFTIPANTPFALTAAGSDPNGDSLTYTWEELDLGTASPPNDDNGSRPIFRSFNPSSSPTRTFPSLVSILNSGNVPPATFSCSTGTCLTGERLPSTTRTMNFIVTARDNRANGGGTSSDQMVLTVSALVGPFAVTAPNTAVSWTGTTMQTVTWSVNGTNGAPVNAANVKISLSTDGGFTFPTTILASTANDGSEVITVPNVTTSTARIKIEAVGNIFFDISNTNFSITASTGSAPVITMHPAPTTTVLTGNVIFFATAATGSPAPTPQWQVSVSGGASWTDIAGATGPNLSFAAQRFDNGKQYRVVYTNASGSTPTNAAALFVRLRVRADLDNDRKADLVVWRPNGGNWFWLKSTAAFSYGNIGVKQWGNSGLGDIPLSADMDGDGIMDLVVWRGSTGTWYWLTAASGFDYASMRGHQWGSESQNDVPLPGDIDGDGKADLIVWRPASGTWFALLSSTNYNPSLALSKQWGNSGLGDIPMLGDFDGDGLADLTVWRASTGTWHWLTSSSFYDYAANGQKQWGNAGLGDIPLVADVDGDGVTDLTVWRASSGTFFWLTAISGFNHALAQQKQWGSGAQNDIPFLGDLDGDGVADLIVWRPASGTWFWLTSSSGFAHASAQSKQWGAAGDIPMIK